MTNAQFKYWEDEKHILIEYDHWGCFLLNETLNPLVNWLNLNHDNIKAGEPCEGNDRVNDVQYASVGGNLVITTRRDFICLSKESREEFVSWLNEHRKILNVREIVVWQN